MCMVCVYIYVCVCVYIYIYICIYIYIAGGRECLLVQPPRDNHNALKNTTGTQSFYFFKPREWILSQTPTFKNSTKEMVHFANLLAELQRTLRDVWPPGEASPPGIWAACRHSELPEPNMARGESHPLYSDPWASEIRHQRAQMFPRIQSKINSKHQSFQRCW